MKYIFFLIMMFFAFSTNAQVVDTLVNNNQFILIKIYKQDTTVINQQIEQLEEEKRQIDDEIKTILKRQRDVEIKINKFIDEKKKPKSKSKEIGSALSFPFNGFSIIWT